MDRCRRTAKGHTQPNTKEAGPSPTSCYPLAPPSYFYAGGHEQGKSAEELAFPNAHGGKLDNWDRWSKSIFRRTGTSGWSRHDLRRTCATPAPEFNLPPHIISIMLGQKTPENNHLLGIYNKGRYRQQHSDALQAVADHLE